MKNLITELVKKSHTILYMKMFGYIELRTIDLPEGLQFRIFRQEGWTDLIAGLVTLGFTFWLAWIWQSVLWMIIFGSAAILASLLLGREIKLSVTDSEFVAIRNRGVIFRAEVRVPTSEVLSVGYDVGAKDQPVGLYVQRTWTHTCILPELDKKYADAMTDAICKRFPKIARGYGQPRSLLFKMQSDTRSLELAEAHQDSDARIESAG